MKLGIIITTYQKPDGSTPDLLKRAIKSINNQIYKNFYLIIIGDQYHNDDEFKYLCNLHEELKDKIYYENLSFANERKKYPLGSRELWCAGGVYAYNYGIDIGLKLGLDYICHLDHDDYWHPEHLEKINYVIEETKDAAMINTCSTFFDTYLPRVALTNTIEPSYPEPCQIVHSSVCINHKVITLKYRDVYEETGQLCAADADFWMRLGSFVAEKGLKTYQFTSITCYHPSETM